MDRIVPGQESAPGRRWVDAQERPAGWLGDRDQLQAPLPVYRSMTMAGAHVVAAIEDRLGVTAATAPVLISDAPELARRARWVCVLLLEREAVGDDPARGREVDLARWHALLGATDEERHAVEGLWRILTGQTQLGSQPDDWPFTLAQWLIAPLRADAAPLSVAQWRRVFVRGGVDRRRAQRMAQAEVAADLECEARLGAALWGELRRSQLMHPLHVAPIGRLIADETHRARALLACGGAGLATDAA